MQEIISIEARTLDRMLKKITPPCTDCRISTLQILRKVFFLGGEGEMAGQSGTLHKANT